jgi:hypothetical protein
MGRQLLQTITASQPWGKLSGSWLQQGSMVMQDKATASSSVNVMGSPLHISLL